MKVLELFAGAGGMALGFHRAGWDTVALAEWDAHAQCVLRTRFPGVPLYGDVRELDGRMLVAEHGPVDLVSGGAPCQDLSVAGKREGLHGDRSILFYDLIRIWEETGARYCLYENVLGALNSQKGADFAAVLSAFVGCPVAVPRRGWKGGGGVVAGPAGVAAWRVLDAQFFGVPQRRRRVFVLGTRPGGVDPAEILLECDGVSWDSASGGQAGEDTADAVAPGVASGDLVGALDTECGYTKATFQSVMAGHVVPDDGIRAVMVPITARMNVALGARDVEEGAIIVVPSLPASGAGTARTGNERTEADLVVVQGYDRYNDALTGPLSPPGQAANSGRIACVLEAMAFHPTQTPVSGAELAPSMGASSGGMGVISFHENQRGEVRETPEDGSLAGGGGKPGQGYAAAVQAGRPRRLMPLECERLMGWEDGWTDVPDPKGKPMADSHRYKMCGNGVVSHCAEWIARRIAELEATNAR